MSESPDPSLLFENEELVALYKPAGVHSLPYCEDEIEASAVGILHKYHPELLKVLGAEKDYGALHRLDEGTSGVLVFGKTHAAYEKYRALWGSRKIEKIYRALTGAGSPPLAPFFIRTAIGHDLKSKKKMRALVREEDFTRIRGKPQNAETEILKIETREEHLDWQIRISTGVRHQIRVHLSSQGFPILGDTLYKGASAERIFLHSWILRIPGEGIEITAPLPEEWTKTL